MTSQLVLVIVVVAAGIGVPVGVYLQAGKHSRRGNSTGSGAADLPESYGEAPAAPQGAALDDPRTGFASTQALAEPDCEAGLMPAGTAGHVGPVESAAPAAPQALHPTEIFAKLFDLALGKPRPLSTVAAGHDEVIAATGAAPQDVGMQQRYAPRRPNMLPQILNASSDDSFKPGKH